MGEREDPNRPGAPVKGTGDDLARLMSEDQPPPRSRAGKAPTLAERARVEAARAVAEQQVAEQQAATTPAAAAQVAPAAAPADVAGGESLSLRRQMRNLQVALAASVLIGIIAISWPGSGESEQDAQAPLGGAMPPGVAQRSPAPMSGPGIQNDVLYQSALRMGLDEDFRQAADLLQRAMDRYPNMEPDVARLVHAQLAYYLRKSGQLAAAMRHQRLSRTGDQRAYLAQELWDNASAAERRGDGVEARRAYARFLLQSGNMSPELRQLIDEAWMGLGDSYELQIRTAEPADVPSPEGRDAAANETGDPVPVRSSGSGGGPR